MKSVISIFYIHSIERKFYIKFKLCLHCIYILARRLENEVKDILDEISADQDLKKDLIRGRQVDLAEELSKSLM